MYRGTTPTLTFETELDKDNVEALYITFAKDKEVILEKRLDDIEWCDKNIKLRLSQEDTLKFKEGTIGIQLRVKFKDETALASDIVYSTAEKILKEGII